MNIVLWPRYQFFEQPNMKGNHWIEWNGKPSSVTMFSTDFSFQNLVIWEFIWIFSGRKLLKDQYVSHSEAKSCQINSILSCSSRSFQQHQRAHSSSSEIFSYNLIYFSVKKAFNIQELLHHKSKCHGTKPFWSRAFQRHQEQDLKHPGSVDLIPTKQNKLPSFIDRWQGHSVTTHPLFWEHLALRGITLHASPA